MDIRSGKKWPQRALSNFAAHSFVIDGVECASMEGFLQSLKCKSPEMQKHICSLIGKAAKFAGKKKKWWKTGKLHWQGQEIDRFSEEYQELLDRAYDALAENAGFRKALLATGNSTLTHSIGKNDSSRTILTESEFVGRLTRLRSKLQGG